MSIKNKKKGFILVKNNKNISILKIFLKIKIIKFVYKKNNNLYVHINYSNNKPVFANIINMFKQSNKKYIKIGCLKQITLNKNWIIILSTNKGLLTNFEALKYNTGGLIIAKIWN